jgi:hypothetical protein
MKRPNSTLLNQSIPREVALRDGDVVAVLSGHIEKVNPKYLMSRQLVDVVGGVVLGSHTVRVEDEFQILNGVDEMSDWLSRTLTEVLSTVSGTEVNRQKVTTRNLRALELFTIDDAALREATRRISGVEEFALLQSSITEDPEFAPAHTWLAWTLMNQGCQSEGCRASAQKAVELSECLFR